MPFQVQVAVLALERNIGFVYVPTGNLKKQEVKATFLTKGTKVCSKLIATSIKYFEKKNKTPILKLKTTTVQGSEISPLRLL